jgi:hypothetical protein
MESSSSVKDHTMHATVGYTTVGYGDVSIVSVSHIDIYSIICGPGDVDIIN